MRCEVTFVMCLHRKVGRDSARCVTVTQIDKNQAAPPTPPALRTAQTYEYFFTPSLIMG